MATQFPRLALSHRDFIAAQHVFFVATAAATGRVNTSPKGTDSLRVLDSNRIVWRNFTGSGNETAGHLAQINRMTLMWCSFDAQPLILRCYGTAQVLHAGQQGWDAANAAFPPFASARQIFEMTIDLVQTSCGWGVPRMTHEGKRNEADDWAAAQGPAGIRAYWAQANRTTLDGFATGIEAAL